MLTIGKAYDYATAVRALKMGHVQIAVVEDTGTDWEDKDYKHCHVIVLDSVAHLVIPIANPLDIKPTEGFKTYLVDDVDFDDFVQQIRKHTIIKTMEVFYDGTLEVTFDELFFVFAKALLRVTPSVALFLWTNFNSTTYMLEYNGLDMAR